MPARPQSNSLVHNPVSLNNSVDAINKFTPPTDLLSGASGRALLHDLDSKFSEQDRLLKFMMGQMQGLEENQGQIKNNSNKARDVDSGQLQELKN